MLPKLHRLRKDTDIKRVFRIGKGHKEDFLFLKLVKNDLKASRFAFIAGQKVSKKAVIRNKIKRRLREAVGSKMPNIKKGFDVVATAQKGLETRSFEELSAATEKILKKAGLIQ